VVEKYLVESINGYKYKKLLDIDEIPQKRKVRLL